MSISFIGSHIATYLAGTQFQEVTTKGELSEEQKMIADLLIKKLEQQDTTETLKTKRLTPQREAQVKGEVNALLKTVFDNMKSQLNDAEKIREARKALADDLRKHALKPSKEEQNLIKELEVKQNERNRKIEKKEKNHPLPTKSAKPLQFVAALKSAMFVAVADLKVNRGFSALSEQDKSTVLKEAKIPRAALAHQNYSNHLMNHPEIGKGTSEMAIKRDLPRIQMSGHLDGKVIVQPSKKKDDLEKADEYLQGLFIGMGIAKRGSGGSLEASTPAGEEIMKVWEDCKRGQKFDKAFDEFYLHLLGEKGNLKNKQKAKELAQLLCGCGQNHFVAPALDFRSRLKPAKAFADSKNPKVHYNFSAEGCVITSRSTITKQQFEPETMPEELRGVKIPNCSIHVVNILRQNPANRTEWSSEIEVIVESRLGSDPKANRENLKLIEKNILQPLSEAGVKVRLA